MPRKSIKFWREKLFRGVDAEAAATAAEEAAAEEADGEHEDEADEEDEV